MEHREKSEKKGLHNVSVALQLLFVFADTAAQYEAFEGQWNRVYIKKKYNVEVLKNMS